VIGGIVAWAPAWNIRRYRIAHIDVNTALLERAGGHLDRAVRHLRAALRRDPRDGSTWVELAQTLEAAGHGEEARTAIQDGLRLAPDDPVLRAFATQR
jgi:Flp pilus assembly protein TadD